ncbi:CFEM domain-containing protein [Colletotrichum paranaense]|uniref:CFEM domain-containing protein n=2 Tax=Colletotrichum acutatum species complex TaxID=2707335 RepID=A0AAI9UFJ7_9PEZI|nr:CFEM domain-containing protein [Colletotrichum paranaense]KAK1457418.1 CFEM domain-containing protein [Colletotrichum melonis]KAK1517271.1 CFEM domain-containing protein [Colletotrichum paranaense]
MQFTTVAVAFFASLVAAQDLSTLPDCATDDSGCSQVRTMWLTRRTYDIQRPCFVDNFPISGCTDQTDFACICASSAYNSAVTTCVLGACELTDALAASSWAQATCAAAGVPI